MDANEGDAGWDGASGEPSPKRPRTDGGGDAGPTSAAAVSGDGASTDADPPPWNAANGGGGGSADDSTGRDEGSGSDGNESPPVDGNESSGNELHPVGGSRSNSEDDSSDSSDSDGALAGAEAFEGELRAHLADGLTMIDAVRQLFPVPRGEVVVDGSAPTRGAAAAAVGDGIGAAGQVAAIAKMADIGEPIIEALKADPSLGENVTDVAQLCAAMYQLAEEEIHEAVVGATRKRLDLGLGRLEDVAKLVDAAQNVVVLSGAGVSVSCGIPDFRSTGGVYETVLKRYGLTDPQAIFDLAEFRMDPRLFYSFAKDIMPSESITPSATHEFIAELDRRGKLLRNYSQNIDGLEHRAGITPGRVVLCHGSFLTATCMLPSCRKQVCGSSITTDVKSGVVPMCVSCATAPHKNDDDDEADEPDEWASVLKPDIVFFGESLPKSVSESLEHDAPLADLVLVLGTSLQVAPVARIPQLFSDSVPRLLVNRELVGYNFDVELLGNCDAVVAALRVALGWAPTAPADPATADPGTSLRALHTKQLPDGAASSGVMESEDPGKEVGEPAAGSTAGGGHCGGGGDGSSDEANGDGESGGDGEGNAPGEH
jgi:NAD-dependent SIR2 family protein deacetylase